MADADTSYGSVTAITCSVHTVPLATGNAQESTAWNATSGSVLDMLVRIKTKGQASGKPPYQFVSSSTSAGRLRQ